MRIGSPACFSKNAATFSTSIFMSASSANVLSRPKMENPMMPAPRAEYMDRSFLIISVSSSRSGSRPLPMKEEMMAFRVFVWLRTLSASRKMRETACPLVPLDVNVLTMHSFGTDRSSNILNSRTGMKGRVSSFAFRVSG